MPQNAPSEGQTRGHDAEAKITSTGTNKDTGPGGRDQWERLAIPQAASFVYPVRSLLTGIQPAQETKHSPTSPASLRPIPAKSKPMQSPEQDDAEHPEGKQPQQGTSLPRRSRSSRSPGRKRTLPNFRDYNTDENPLAPRSFTTRSTSPLTANPTHNFHYRHDHNHNHLNHHNTNPSTNDLLCTSGPAGEPVTYHPSLIHDFQEDIADHFIRRHPVHLSEAAVEAFTDVILAPGVYSPLPMRPDQSQITNYSQSGIVHLPPFDPDAILSPPRSNSQASSSIGPPTRPISEGPVEFPTLALSSTASNSDRTVASDPVTIVRLPSTHASRPASPTSGPPSAHASSRSTSGTSSDDGPHITFRYTHLEDEHGHHLIVGREGSLTKCEDEPIRTPGAVQGFGVLIAIEEDEDTGNLVVRQVSENSTELLGLSPQYLFSLECFTQTFSDHQADILFDNIQYLSDAALTAEEQAENLHVFMLTGFGAPGSALPEELPTADPLQRRTWTCWCAAHRPQMTAPGNLDSSGESTDAALDSNIIILEFELERDAFNPLYPPPPGATSTSSGSFRSGVSSPLTDASNGNMSTSESSGRTLVSTDSGEMGMGRGRGGTERSTPEGSTPSLVNSDPAGSSSVNASVTANSPTPSSQDSSGQSAYQRSSLGGGGSSSGGGVGIRGGGSGSGSGSGYQASRGSNGNTSESAESGGENGDEEWLPSPEDILESTTTRSKPLLALERLRRSRRGMTDSPSPGSSYSAGSHHSSSDDRGGSRPRRAGLRQRRGGGGGGGAVGMMDVFAVMAQINEQLGAAPDLEHFLQVVVGVIKDLTQFHRVLVYQFDEAWNGKVVAELVDWNMTHDLFKGLHFPASDIPAQARSLYALNKVRLLYDRGQPTARLVVRSRKDLDTPLDMTHCYLRSMSPIHLQYLGNMGVRASMSISILAFGNLWGLVACHSYGPHGMRVSFPVRQMLRLLSQSISRNVERLSYAQRLHTRKLINTMPTEQHPSGYIVSNADDLLGLFDADYGVLVIGEGAKILGPNQHSQEILIVAEYLRLKQFDTMQVSQAVTVDYPDLQLSTGLEVIAGLLYVPLSVGGRDFIAFLRKGQPRQVKWAGRPYRQGEQKHSLEPRTSFKIWSETVAGRCRVWTDEHLETAGVLALVYGKFIEVWRQKETALQATKLTNILLSNASHEVRTPLNHIINYLELALNGHLDAETRENLSQSHAASKSLLFTINDLLDLTRLESGNETSFNEPFNLRQAIDDATLLYRNEAARRGIHFELDTSQCPKTVVGDVKKIRTVVANLTANAVKYTTRGQIRVQCHAFEEPPGLRSTGNVAVEIVVADTGCGISGDRLEGIFREFEQVEVSHVNNPPIPSQGLGLGLAVVARIVEQLGGQLRVDSKIEEGSRFSFLIPFATEDGSISSPSTASVTRSLPRTRTHSYNNRDDEIDNLVQALSSSHMIDEYAQSTEGSSVAGTSGSLVYVEPRPKRVEESFIKLITQQAEDEQVGGGGEVERKRSLSKKPVARKSPSRTRQPENPGQLRVLIVEDNDINRTILAKRLSLDGHVVVNTTNGQEGVEMVESDREFDCVLMDIQMPLLNGYEATERIRALEEETKDPSRRFSHVLNGRLPIFAVSASLREDQREDMYNLGIDGWILKPIDFKRLRVILKGVTDRAQREKDVYKSGCNWEVGGWLTRPRYNQDDQIVSG